MVTQAPVIFGTIFVALVGGLFWLFNWRYGKVIEELKGAKGTVEERLKLRDEQIAQFKAKVGSESPDEVRNRIQALESQLQSVLPRKLSDQQKSTIRGVVGSLPKGLIEIGYDASSSDALGYSRDFVGLFKNEGWRVTNPMVMGPAHHPMTGLALIVSAPQTLTPTQVSIKHALDAAGLEFELLQGPQSVVAGGAASEAVMLVTTRRT